jgi:hypothetical protein
MELQMLTYHPEQNKHVEGDESLDRNSAEDIASLVEGEDNEHF